MRAVQVSRFGAPEVLELVERAAPVPAAGQVSIRVSYAGVNFAEVMARRGDYHGASSPPFVPGLEVAGDVEAVGEGVHDLVPGQSVVAFTATGGYAEVALASAALTLPYDAEAVDPAVAAALPTVVPAALLLVDQVARLGQGETVLIHAAGGGLGTVLGQLARQRCGGGVIGTVGDPSKIEYARSFGYEEVVQRSSFAQTVDERTAGRGADAVFDSIGGSVRAASLEALAPLGRLVAFGNASREPEVLPDAGHLRADNKGVLGFSMGSLTRTEPRSVRLAIQRSIELVTGKEVDIDVTEVFQLTDAVRAHQRLESGATRGKLVLRVGAP